jgi:hypothetical protein
MSIPKEITHGSNEFRHGCNDSNERPPDRLRHQTIKYVVRATERAEEGFERESFEGPAQRTEEGFEEGRFEDIAQRTEEGFEEGHFEDIAQRTEEGFEGKGFGNAFPPPQIRFISRRKA